MDESKIKQYETTDRPGGDFNPDNLMKEVNKPRLGKLLAVSLAVHIFLLLVLSIGFFMECRHYGTFRIKDARKKEYELKKKADEEKQNQELIKKAEEEAKKKKEAEKNAPPPAPKPEAPKTGEEIKVDPSKPVPEIIQKITETSKERPSSTDVNLDNDLK